MSHWIGRLNEVPARLGYVVKPSNAESAVSRRKRRRLRLFGLGNDSCPICLRPFTKQAVEEGKTVTLEHAPAQSFKVGGIEMCLTCADCNHRAGRAEQVAVDAAHDEVKVRLDLAGLPPFSARVAVRADRSLLLQVSSRKDVTSGVFDKALRDARTLTMKGQAPTAHYVNVPWLKAAYLSVFSLLGVHGYKYAEGAAVEAVREQIMKPGDEIIPRFAAEASTWKQRSGILVSGKTPGWVVKMGERIVLLPRGWDETFYERIGNTPADDIIIGDGPLWFPAQFGANRGVRVLTVREGHRRLELLGEDLFGATGQVTQDGETIPFVVVDCRGQEVTIMITAGLEETLGADDGGGVSNIVQRGVQAGALD